MMDEITITDEVVEVPLAEYEAIKLVADNIAQQNTLILKYMNALTDAINSQAAALNNQGKQLADAVIVMSQAVSKLSFVANISQPVINVPPAQVTNEITVQPSSLVLPPMPSGARIHHDKVSGDAILTVKE